VIGERTYILYWMQSAQRVQENPALSYAIEIANSLHKPLIVCFGLTGDFLNATKRHYRFLLEGLSDVETRLKEMGIRFVLSPEGPIEGPLRLAGDAAMMVTDFAYGKLERLWRKEVAARVSCSLVQIETNVVVPVETASSKEEYSAATLRRKIEPMIAHFVSSIPLRAIKISSTDIALNIPELSLSDIPHIMSTVNIPSGASECSWISGGETAAQNQLNDFIENRLEGYGSRHNDPADPYDSGLSPYLHFGHISPVSIYNEVVGKAVGDVSDFIEELIVRRELAINFVYYNPRYDSYSGLPEWAQKSLSKHEVDPREYCYTYRELLSAKTHDPYWNAAQQELVYFGTMHGYMRMYWGKKILEWSPSPQQAFSTALDLNNRFQLDGRDPNGYAGVAWCFGKHDRPWVERPIFGNVRYMNDKGLERKFAIKRYVERIEKAKERSFGKE
jgi:deoxyribodipyrimidine photo-lyase